MAVSFQWMTKSTTNKKKKKRKKKGSVELNSDIKKNKVKWARFYVLCIDKTKTLLKILAIWLAWKQLS